MKFEFSDFLVFIIITLLFASTGCNLLNKRPGEGTQDRVIGGPGLGKTPTFNIPRPEGYSQVTYHDFLAESREIQLEKHAGDMLYVFVKDLGTWFNIGTRPVTSFYYSYEETTGIIAIHGYPRLPLEYCVFQYTHLQESRLY